MADWGGFCPVCGKNNAAEEAEQILQQEQPDMELEAAEQTDCLLPEEEEGEYEPSPKTKKMKRNMAMAGCFAVLALLATVLFFGIRSEGDTSKWFGWLLPKENNIYCKDTFTVEDKKVEKKGDVVVATMGDVELTNTQLQFYYWSEVYDFLRENYYYLSYIGLDYTAPLDEQFCQLDKNMTWQQYFLQGALETWQSNMTFALMAKENNFQMPEEYRKALDNMESELAATAQKNGYESVDALVQESYGAGCTMEDYLEYMENYYLGNLYFAELYGAIDPTVEELDAYFKANQEALESSGIKQDDTYTVDVRHILIRIDTIAAEMEKDSPKAGESEDKDETTTEKYTEEQWEACRQAAQAILDEYLAGELTEDRFGELANKHSEDKGGQVTDGGIYTYVEKGQMVATFNDWCFDAARKEGDTGLVKTQFGYHVMYFVGSEEVWITKTRSAYLSEKSNELVADALSRFTMEVNYKKIVLGNVTL